MKILICTDGSDNSWKCVEVVSRMAAECNVNHVAIIHVHEGSALLPDYWHGSYPFTSEEKNQIISIDKRLQEERERYFAKATEEFAKHGIQADTIFKVGRPAETIAKLAAAENYDLIVIGRKGVGGIKKMFLGSVSNAVLQIAATNVLIVK